MTPCQGRGMPVDVLHHRAGRIHHGAGFIGGEGEQRHDVAAKDFIGKDAAVLAQAAGKNVPVHVFSWIYLFGGAALFLFALALIVLFFTDLDHQLLPDDITLPLLWLGLLVYIGLVLVTFIGTRVHPDEPDNQEPKD